MDKELENLKVVIELVTDKFKESIKTLEKFVDQLSASVGKIKDFGKEITDSKNSIGKFGDEIKESEDNVKEFSKKINAANNTVNEFDDGVGDALAQVSEFGGGVEKAKDRVDKFADNIVSSTTQMVRFGDKIADASVSTDKFKDNMEKSKDSMGKFTETIDMAKGSMQKYADKSGDLSDSQSDLKDKTDESKGVFGNLVDKFSGALGIVGSVSGAFDQVKTAIELAKGSWEVITSVISYFNKESDGVKYALYDAEEATSKFNDMLLETEVAVSTQTSALSTLKKDGLDKFTEAYEDVALLLAENDLSISIDINELIGASQSMVSTLRTSLTECGDETYKTLAAMYSEMSYLTEEEESKALSSILTNNAEKIKEFEGHASELEKIEKRVFDNKGVWREEDRIAYDEHLSALRDMATKSLSENESMEIGMRTILMQKKGELTEEELAEYKKLQDAADEDKKNRILIETANQKAAIEERWKNDLNGLVEGTTEWQDIKDQMDAELLAHAQEAQNKLNNVTYESVNTMAELITGANAEQVRDYQNCKDEVEEIVKKYSAYDASRLSADVKAKYDAEMKIVGDRQLALGITQSKLDEFYEYLEDQPLKYGEVYKLANKEITLDGAKDNMTTQVDDFKEIGETAVDNFKDGVKAAATPSSIEFQLKTLINGAKAIVAYTPPKVSEFAVGGVITRPTVGLMGEYPNANLNPEIVTPQNIMSETFAKVLSSFGFGNSNEPIQIRNVVELDGAKLSEKVSYYQRRRDFNTGGNY